MNSPLVATTGLEATLVRNGWAEPQKALKMHKYPCQHISIFFWKNLVRKNSNTFTFCKAMHKIYVKETFWGLVSNNDFCVNGIIKFEFLQFHNSTWHILEAIVQNNTSENITWSANITKIHNNLKVGMYTWEIFLRSICLYYEKSHS